MCFPAQIRDDPCWGQLMMGIFCCILWGKTKGTRQRCLYNRRMSMSQTDVPFERPGPRRPLSIGAGAVVIHEGRVLLARNIYGATRGRYLLPAGRVNAGELPDVAAARETFEETNLRVGIEGLLGIRIWVMDDGE